MFTTSLPKRIWLLVVRLLPRRLHTRGTAAAARVTRLDVGDRAVLARNLSRMLRPKAAA